MLIRHRDRSPSVDSSAYVAASAELIGEVVVGSQSRVMSGAVLDAEGSRVEIGDCTIVCEHAVVRATAVGDEEHPVIVGDHAFLGPHTTLLGCTVAAAAYLATNATVVHGAIVGTGAVVAVGALVHAGAVVPPEFLLPPGMIAIGDPLEIYAPGDPGLTAAIKAVGFARRAFGVDADWEDPVARYRRIATVRSDEFGAHRDDKPEAG